MSFFIKYNWFFRPKYLLLVIIVVASFFRLWGLGSAEIFHDEGAYAFRAIGYLDFLANENQTTPVQWFREGSLPGWTKLSMHDHPPFYFWTVRIFAGIFGDKLWALRLPSALAGILTVILVYKLLTYLFKNEYAGLFGAGLLAVNHMHIWLSRSILMESLLLFFIFSAIYAFVLFLENNKNWLWLGLTMGLVALTKYTGVFLVPAFAIYALIFRRDIFKSYHLYAAAGLTLLIFSPVLFYNLAMYKAVGHFDLQLSFLLGQEVPEWQASFGKIQNPFFEVGQTMVDMYSILFLVLSLAGLIYSVLRFGADSSAWYLLFVFMAVFITLILAAVGSAQRFVALYLVSFVPLVVVFTWFIIRKFKTEWWLPAAFAIFFIYEIAFSVSGIFLTFPDFGALKLDKYLDAELGVLASRFPPESPNQHLNNVIRKYLSRLSPSDKATIIIYDENISLAERLWLFQRRTFYHGITAMSTRLFNGFIQSRGIESLSGYNIYFARATGNTALNPYFSTSDAADFERFLVESLGLMPAKLISGHNNLPMFMVYKFVL